MFLLFRIYFLFTGVNEVSFGSIEETLDLNLGSPPLVQPLVSHNMYTIYLLTDELCVLRD